MGKVVWTPLRNENLVNGRKGKGAIRSSDDYLQGHSERLFTVETFMAEGRSDARIFFYSSSHTLNF